ncbi:MAG: hypothetical protein DI536_05090 [Archangium gephyra]|uniref:Uncharacterized protein n=1 Tax=Archangium gephyra TaxID=48 RepID=A0A2W5VPJ8_9BACT|nr:MAG: hypothetical protein DI536_05090 [Archangium gephyra]
MSQGKSPTPDQKKPAKPDTTTPSPEDARVNDAKILNSVLTQHQKQSFGSGFNDSSAERRRNSLLAVAIPAVATSAGTQGLQPVSNQKFDGKTVPLALQNRDLWKAVPAPLQSVPGKRSEALYASVVNQFGVTVNPRYEEDAPGKGRGHIFVWDVSRAMNCEIPHFVGAKELSLVQTCDWLRHEGPMRGWKRANDYELLEGTSRGWMVVVMPKDRSIRQIAIVAPQKDEGKPKLTGVGLIRSDGAFAKEMFGANPLECFYHE